MNRDRYTCSSSCCSRGVRLVYSERVLYVLTCCLLACARPKKNTNKHTTTSRWRRGARDTVYYAIARNYATARDSIRHRGDRAGNSSAAKLNHDSRRRNYVSNSSCCVEYSNQLCNYLRNVMLSMIIRVFVLLCHVIVNTYLQKAES